MKPVPSQNTNATGNTQAPAPSLSTGTPSGDAPRLHVPPGAPLLFPAGHPVQGAPHDERADYQFVGDVILSSGATVARRRGCTIL